MSSDIRKRERCFGKINDKIMNILNIRFMERSTLEIVINSFIY